MRTYEQWMDEYGVSHKNPTNQMVHKICVPLIMLTILGVLWKIPRPEAFAVSPYLNWASLFCAFCLCFYLTLNFKMFIAMVIQTSLMLWICHQLDQMGILLSFSIIVFILAWIGQFWGHKVEGKKPSFLQDLVFLLIGPLWVTRFLFKKVGIEA